MHITTDVDKHKELAHEVFEVWLHQVWELVEAGRPLQPDPFYERNELLVPEVVENVINYVVGAMQKEFEKFPQYHNRAQGVSTSEILVPPDFDNLPYTQKLAIVQGIDRIMQKFKVEPSVERPPESRVDETRLDESMIYDLWTDFLEPRVGC